MSEEQNQTNAAEGQSELTAVVMCKYCGGTGEIEMDNNGPIVQCPLCSKDKTDEQFMADSFRLSMKSMDRERVNSRKAICTAFNMKEVIYSDGQECSKNCSRHIISRCEKCGRYAAKGKATVFEPASST